MSLLAQVRGIRGQISWEEFLQRTGTHVNVDLHQLACTTFGVLSSMEGSTVDVLAMQAHHPNEGHKVS